MHIYYPAMGGEAGYRSLSCPVFWGTRIMGEL
jgi:hypothetical protein